ncbi:4-hydroxyproline epimerase [Pseudogemmobacter humi]|uniref:4-hydroxyproline epimerase n=1 Tax=Pseudogemmobacter humi TaxID=2483812 RepID=A0A3P5X2N5_9RHOB|nr:4-hydroxyproline epimerase [Pseudogemmobacter humi]VDC28658.1 4-hydroxyproline epimerase [Pseudogemmobacter humi]
MRKMFFCIDGHTGGNPVRMVMGGAPFLQGATMSARRLDFLARYDWIRRALMFEPRGHDLMSGGFILPPLDPANDAAFLFMETSGCLPLCGHGSVGMITFALEHGLILPRGDLLRIEVPAGLLEARFTREGTRVTSVSFESVPSFLFARDVVISDPRFGRLRADIAYGGNFYAIIEPQEGYGGVADLGLAGIAEASPRIRRAFDAAINAVHPGDPSIRGVSHLIWSDALDPDGRGSSAAIFFGNNGIDHGPCGTGTAARLAQLAARGLLTVGQPFDQRSHVGTRFTGTIAGHVKVGSFDAIRPVLAGQAHVTGYNQIWTDSNDPFPEGFQVLHGAPLP